MCNPTVFFVDHMAIKYLVNKAELSGRLARWVILLEEFDYTVLHCGVQAGLDAFTSRPLVKIVGRGRF